MCVCNAARADALLRPAVLNPHPATTTHQPAQKNNNNNTNTKQHNLHPDAHVEQPLCDLGARGRAAKGVPLLQAPDARPRL